MRPLNRPMFRYGGPIKEGIMSGIKDNRVPFDKGGYLDNLLAKTGALFNPLRKIPGGKQISKFIQKQKIQIPPSRVPNTTGMGGVQLTPGQIKAGMGTTAVPLGTRIKQFASLNPKFTYGAAPFVVSGAITATPPVLKGLYGTAKTIGLEALDRMVPDAFFDQDQYFADKKIREQNEQNKKLQNQKKNLKGEQNELTTGTNKIDRDAEIEANRQRYYKILGIDKMKKDAAYDSLLDASNIVREEGADLKGAIKSGTLQSKIINAISKNLDKSADIKRQIDAAIVKSEIEKDIKASDPQAQKRADLLDKQIKIAEKTLAGADLADTLSELRKQGIVPEGSELASLALRNDIDIPKGHVLNTKDVNTFLKDNPTLTVVDFLNDQNLKLQQAGKGGLTPGKYVVGSNILEVGEDGSVVDVII